MPMSASKVKVKLVGGVSSKWHLSGLDTDIGSNSVQCCANDNSLPYLALDLSVSL